MQKLNGKLGIFSSAWPLGIGSASLCMGMDWLFFATKASFMDSFHLLGKAGALVIPGVVLGVASGGVSLGLNRLLPVRLRQHLKPGLWIPALWLAMTLLLLLDNFVYTLIRYGIVNSGAVGQVLFLLVLSLLFKKSLGWMAELEELISTPRRLRLSLACSALLAGGAIALAAAEWRTAPALLGLRPPVGLQSRPNLLFVAADGIEAEVLSAYGYSRDTSPQIRKLAEESLVAENAFVHAGKTTGSTTALLTGMLPSHSKVAYPPQILSRELAFQHLPALLRSEGYRGFQRSMRHYADSADINLRAAFEQANGRRVRSAEWPSTLQKAAHVLNAELYFFERSWERLESRLLHLLRIRRMDDPFLTVKVNRGLGVGEDRKTIDEAIAYIDSAPTQPFFMHLHLMATHCCRYRGGTPFFRPGPKLSPELSARLNLIRDVDAEIGRLVDHLRARGILENTIVVVSSDHSARWDSLQRVPLIIRFPNGRHRGRIKSNVGFVDVAPTLLDALGLPIPDWMDGHSLLASSGERAPAPLAPVLTVPEFSYRQFKLKGMGHLSQMTDPGPPLYGFKSFASIQCNVWQKLELATGQMTSGEIPGHTRPCAASSLLSPDEARRRILEHLESQGFTIPPAR